MARLAYISFDQVPAPKGAATHIEAFVRALALEFGGVHLVTVGGSANALERWPGVTHWELPALGPSLIDRVMSFGRLLSRWLAGRRYDVIHFRSIFEGLPILKHRNGAALVFEVNSCLKHKCSPVYNFHETGKIQAPILNLTNPQMVRMICS